MAEPQQLSGDTTEEQGLAPAGEGPTSGVGVAAAELATAIREARQTWGELSGADKGTIWAAVLLMLSTLLPFVGVPGDPYRPGVMGGGLGLWLFAVWALRLTGDRARALGILEGGADLADHEDSVLRRISLKQLLCGALCTGYALYLLVLYWKFTEVRTVTGERLDPILRPGLFVALFFSTGLAYAGLVRFRAEAARRREG